MNRHVLIRFITALTLLIGISGGYLWWNARLQKITDSTIALTQQISDARIKLSRTESEHAEINRLTNDEATIYSHLVADSSVVSFLSTLEKSGTVFGAQVLIASVSLESNTKRPMLGISVKVTGSFNAVMRAVGVIENAPYYVTVNALTVKNKISSNKKKSYWTATFKLNAGFIHSVKSTTT